MSNESMQGAADNGRSPERSPSFPFISLSQALERARQFYDAEKRSAAPYKVAAKHWNYSESSSGAAQTVGALKNYGLMVDEGSGPSRKVRLSEMALRILLDSRPDSSEKAALMRKAALSPSIAAKVNATHPDGLPSDATLRHELVFSYNFSPKTAEKASDILIENEVLTGFFAGEVGSKVGDNVNDLQGAADVDTQLDASVARSAPTYSATTQRVVERIRGPGGEIVVQTDREPTWEDYDFLEKYIALRKSVLKQKQ